MKPVKGGVRAKGLRHSIDVEERVLFKPWLNFSILPFYPASPILSSDFHPSFQLSINRRCRCELYFNPPCLWRRWYWLCACFHRSSCPVEMVEGEDAILSFNVTGQNGKGRLPCRASVSSPILHSTRLARGFLRPLPGLSRPTTMAQSSTLGDRTRDSASTTSGSSSTSPNAKRLSLLLAMVAVLPCWASWLWLHTSTVKGE